MPRASASLSFHTRPLFDFSWGLLNAQRCADMRFHTCVQKSEILIKNFAFQSYIRVWEDKRNKFEDEQRNRGCCIVNVPIHLKRHGGNCWRLSFGNIRCEIEHVWRHNLKSNRCKINVTVVIEHSPFQALLQRMKNFYCNGLCLKNGEFTSSGGFSAINRFR